jgi:hypothetical protein
MVEPQIVVLDVAGSSPVDHPTFFSLFSPTNRVKNTELETRRETLGVRGMTTNGVQPQP